MDEECIFICLAHQRAAGRMIRAVDLRVATDAAAVQQERARSAAGEPLRRVDDRGMAGPLVTGLTEKRSAYLEKCRLRRAVRAVAIGTVLCHRLMLPQERAAEFGVAGRAGLRDGVLDELCRITGSVRRMAGRA